ncbi:MAG: hypothetical protein CSA95_05275 [Bacteroidetes bacterium]|nr:MAG: hypothetical protein CSA95_05275 [Bacteroidota bacterium]PIE88232.1 MAG: hypothetical protein CSA04_02935 [Bacteroidota bacterium]
MNSRRTFVILFFLLLAWVSLFFTMCASEKPPSGGPKDIAPPMLLSEEPVFGTPNFQGKVIKVNFNEYLQLKNLNKEMVISPPMSVKPEVQVRGRSLVIRLKDDLKEATTYNLFLGDAIADLNEGNPYSDYRYVFSTGAYVDSLAISGIVEDALTGDPVSGAWVVLYPSGEDTLFFSSTPYYVASTDESGHFMLDYLSDTLYRCFAIEDINGNYYYDLPLERIAFLDTLVKPGYRILESDSLRDSIRVIPSLSSCDLRLRLYTEPDTVLKLMEHTLVEDYVVDFIFNNPVSDLHFRSLDSLPLPHYIAHEIGRGDTVRWWITDTTRKVMNLVVSNGVEVLDSVRVVLCSSEEEGRPLVLSNNLMSAGLLPPEEPFSLAMANPIALHPGAVGMLIKGADTLIAPFRVADSLGLSVVLDSPLWVDSSYNLIVEDSMLVDIYGHTNDSVMYQFRVAKESDFGVLEMEMILPEREEGSYLLSLTEPGGNEVASSVFVQSTTVRMPRLLPGKYTLTLLFDVDANGQWSSGRLTKHVQPERLEVFEKTVEIRANWTVRETWAIME